MVFSASGEPFPIELANKTVKELKDMGFVDLGSFEVKKDPKSNGMRPYMTEEEKLKLEKSIKELEMEDDDPEFHLETPDY